MCIGVFGLEHPCRNTNMLSVFVLVIYLATDCMKQTDFMFLSQASVLQRFLGWLYLGVEVGICHRKYN